MPAHSCTGRSTARLLIAAVVAVLGLFAGSAAAGQAPDRDRGPGFAAAHAGRAQVARWIGSSKTRLDTATDLSHAPTPVIVVALAGLIVAALVLIGGAPGTRRSVRAGVPRLPGVRGPPTAAL